MSEFEQHRVLHRLDDPLRVLYWTVDEIALAVGLTVLGYFAGFALIGFIAGASSTWLLIKFKKKLGGGTLRHALYWYFPHVSHVLKVTPPSYKLEYVG